MEKPLISLIIPVYNEEQNIYTVFERIIKTIGEIKDFTFEVIAVNDGSTDNGEKILKSLPEVLVITHDINRGYGASLKSGIKKSKGEWIFIIDCDGSHPIEDMSSFLFHLEDYDMIVGARKGEKGSIPVLRGPAKYFLRQLANYLAGTKIPDLNSGFRVFRRDVAMRFFGLFPDGFSFTITITLACLTNNYKVKYIPIKWKKRSAGKSSINPVRDFTNFLMLITRIIIYFKPLNIFLPGSIILFLIGLIKLIIDFLHSNQFGVGAVMVILVSILLFFLGLVADLIIKRTSL